ncbi:unnamed protein product [Adineta ricciae]|uniref:Uncharacterized protein n=1 Tax=Adineta ricciae TaxID=249248 RepID=A0A815L0T9_ADIRI|nr:unnamed protein product [Adineta ricciae]
MLTVLAATVDYAREKTIESLYTTTTCFVTSFENYTDCSGGVCVIMRKYEVVYNVSDGRTIESTTIESGGPGPNSVNRTAPCYYHGTKVRTVRWEWPNPRIYFAIMSVVWPLLIISTILPCVYIYKS